MKHYTTDIKYMQLDSKHLIVDESYQRDLDAKRVKRIVDNFNPLLLNPIKVSERDGGYYVFDGQHTLAALKMRNGGKDLLVECKVFTLGKMADVQKRQVESELFAQQNGESRAVGTNDKFRAKLLAGDDEIALFHRLTNQTGVQMDFTRGSRRNKITCCREAYAAFTSLTFDAYVDMLSVIREVWGGHKEAFRAEIIGGMTEFYQNYYGEFKRDLLVQQLSKISPLHVIREGNISTESGKSKYANQIFQAYNKSRRANRLKKILLGKANGNDNKYQFEFLH